jgi:hypothetical protein
MVRYRLGEQASRSRARATAALEAAAVLAPMLLVLALIHSMRYAGTGALALVAGALVVLAAVRAALVHARLLRRLQRFEVTLDGDVLAVDTATARLSAPRAAVKRVVELGGALGGLRIELATEKDPRLPDRIDVPRGGEGFGELRAALEAWCGVERAKRRGRLLWIAVGFLVVAVIFFLPFALDDAARSRWVALAVVLGAWIVLRLLVQRR